MASPSKDNAKFATSPENEAAVAQNKTLLVLAINHQSPSLMIYNESEKNLNNLKDLNQLALDENDTEKKGSEEIISNFQPNYIFHISIYFICELHKKTEMA